MDDEDLDLPLNGEAWLTLSAVFIFAMIGAIMTLLFIVP
jgi:hypothetical protein